MNESEKKPGGYRVTLIEGDRIPQTHPDSLVEWPPGRPPGGQPINPPGSTQLNKPANQS